MFCRDPVTPWLVTLNTLSHPASPWNVVFSWCNVYAEEIRRVSVIIKRFVACFIRWDALRARGSTTVSLLSVYGELSSPWIGLHGSCVTSPKPRVYSLTHSLFSPFPSASFFHLLWRFSLPTKQEITLLFV